MREHFHYNFDLVDNQTRVEFVGAIFNSEGARLTPEFTAPDFYRVKEDLRYRMLTEREQKPGMTRMFGRIKRVIRTESTHFTALEE